MKCNKCKIEKKVNCFYKRNKKKAGREKVCIECTKERNRKRYRLKNPKVNLGQFSKCTNCNTIKDIKEFNKNGKYTTSRCTKCIYKIQRKSHLLNKYNLTIDDYNKLLLQQNKVCAICGKKSYRNLCVDHDHKTGKIRALLCDLCNTGLGKFKDNIELLEKASIYLKNIW